MQENNVLFDVEVFLGTNEHGMPALQRTYIKKDEISAIVPDRNDPSKCYVYLSDNSRTFYLNVNADNIAEHFHTIRVK